MGLFGPKIDPQLIYGYSKTPQPGYGKVVSVSPPQGVNGALPTMNSYANGMVTLQKPDGSQMAVSIADLTAANNQRLIAAGSPKTTAPSTMGMFLSPQRELFPGAVDNTRYMPIPGYVAPKEEPKKTDPVTTTATPVTTSTTSASGATVKAGPTQAEVDARRQESLRLRQEQEAQDAARQQAQAYTSGRQQLLDETTGGVNSAFAGFDDAYFDTFAKDYANYYTPQVGYQYDDAMKKLQLKYADAGTTNSSYQTDLGSLLTRRQEQEAKVQADAKAAADTFRGTVTGKKTALLGDLVNPEYAGSDTLPSGADVQSTLGILKTKLSPFAAKAADAAKGIARPGYTALTDLFGDLTTGPGFSGQANTNTDINFDASGLYQPKAGTAARIIS